MTNPNVRPDLEALKSMALSLGLQDGEYWYLHTHGGVTLPALAPLREPPKFLTMEQGIVFVEAVNNLIPLIAHIERLEASADDAVATLAAVRATTISDTEWQESRMHFRDLCGQTIAQVNATLTQGTTHD